MHSAVDDAELVRRHIARDDLLHLAAEAGTAVTILDSSAPTTPAAPPAHTGPGETYTEAIRRHLLLADHSAEPSIRAESLMHAAVLARFCVQLQRLGHAVPPVTVDIADLHARAETELAGRDVTLEVTQAYPAIRELRLSGDIPAAIAKASRSPAFYAGSGAEMYRGHVELDRVFSYLTVGQWKSARDSLAEAGQFWSEGAGAERLFPTRGRYEQAVAVVAAHHGDLDTAIAHLDTAATHLTRYTVNQVAGHVECLSVHVTQAELLAAAGRGTGDVVAACVAALDRFEEIRARWAVVARSPSPPALVLRLVLGDIARVLAGMGADIRPDVGAARPGAGSADPGRLGFRLSLAAKHSGIAALVRSQRTLLNTRTADMMRDIVEAEHELAALGSSRTARRDSTERTLAGLRDELQASVSGLLADIVLPQRVDIDSVLANRGDAVILDFVALPMTDGSRAWFRSTVYGDGDVAFEQVTVGSGYDDLFTAGVHGDTGLLDDFRHPLVASSDAWRRAATEFLPERLRDLLTRPEPRSGAVVDLLISPHRELSRVPWSALQLETPSGRLVRLVERANVLQTPLLTTYAADVSEPAVGPAIVRIDAARIEARAELAAWGLPYDGSAVTLAECGIGASESSAESVEPKAESVAPQAEPPVELDGPLAARLADGADRWGLAYVACHGVVGTPALGSVSGFQQRLRLPDGDLTAGEALGLHWPAAVMLNACHLGAVLDADDEEPMGFVIAAMVGGARCVVGALHVVGAGGAERVGAAVAQGLDGRTPLHRLVHAAQRQAAADREYGDPRQWASLAVYVR